jgi:hypothetical protein
MNKPKVETNGCRLSNQGALTRYYMFRKRNFSVREAGDFAKPIGHATRGKTCCGDTLYFQRTGKCPWQIKRFKKTGFLVQVGSGKARFVRKLSQALKSAVSEINSLPPKDREPKHKSRTGAGLYFVELVNRRDTQDNEARKVRAKSEKDAKRIVKEYTTGAGGRWHPGCVAPTTGGSDEQRKIAGYLRAICPKNGMI